MDYQIVEGPSNDLYRIFVKDGEPKYYIEKLINWPARRFLWLKYEAGSRYQTVTNDVGNPKSFYSIESAEEYIRRQYNSGQKLIVKVIEVTV